METHRCPQCNALVVDRRSPFCTSCHASLPAEWVMISDQVAKIIEFNASATAEHNAAMNDLGAVPTQLDAKI